MKKIVTKIAIAFSLVFLVGLSSSCIDSVYSVQCDNAVVEVFNNTNEIVYYSIDPNDDYCEHYNSLYPGQSLFVNYGFINADSNFPEFQVLYIRYGSYGYSDVRMDIEIEECDNLVYIN